jgi:uncharacterized membrane protein YjdF
MQGRWSVRVAALVCLAIFALTGAVLWAMGRPLWCAGGEPWLWAGEVWSRHNSQHLFDPYTLTHLSHGIVFVWVLRLVLGRRTAGSALGVVVAVALEAAWEIVENTDFVIRRYREATISLDYYGDSVANSLGDVLAMLVGYVATMRLPVRSSALALVALEAGLALWIRDGLALNVLMLVRPVEAIRTWQMGLSP